MVARPGSSPPPPPPPPHRTERVLRAIEHIEGERFDQAISLLRRVLTAEPKNGHAHRVMCNAFMLKMQREPAAFHARLALAHAPPADAEFLYALGRQMRQFLPGEEVAAVFRRAVTIAPHHGEAWVGLVEALMFSMNYSQAVAAAREGLTHHPDHAALTLNLAVALENTGRADEAMALLSASPELRTEPFIAAGLALCSNHSGKTSAGVVAQAHRDFGRLFAATHPRPASPPRPEPDVLSGRPLRVGFLSPDLRAHAVASFFEPLLTHLDHQRVQPFCYSTTTEPDAITARLRQRAHRFVDAPLMTDAALEALIRGDRLDMLLELSGLTSGHRLAVVHRKPAPITATYLGYPASTGLASIDYRIVDSRTDPAGTPYDAQGQSVERLARLDPCFVCYQPPAVEHDPGPRQTERTGPLVFGSFNMHKKLSDVVLSVYADLLAAVADSRLVLKNFALGSPALREAFTLQLRDLGIDPARVELRPPAKSHREHLAQYHDLDVALDTFPYCGTTTTCEALFMGVPVVSLVGDRHAARVGYSLLCALGHPEWCATTREDFASCVVKTVAAHRRGGQAGGELRAQLLASPLCDGAGFARRFEGLMLDLCARRAT